MWYRPFQHKNVSYVKLAPYRRIFRQGAPILMYHKIGSPPPETRIKSLYVPSSLLKRQLQEFRQERFRTVGLDRWATFTEPNDRQFVVTFDDGSRSVFQSACSLLADFHFSAIQYLVADLIGGKNEWDTVKGEVEDPLMSDSEVREWLSAGHEIGSHTLTHPHLTRLDPQRAREEIFSSKTKLEDRFGIPIRHFCYPYGSWNQKIRDLVEEAGYETAVTVDPGVCTDPKDPFVLPRITVRQPPRNWRTFLSQFLPWTV